MGFDYWEEHDLLYVNAGEKCDYCIEPEDGIVLDIKDGKKVTGVEIFDASKRLGLSKKLLNTIKTSKITSVFNNGVIGASFVLTFSDSPVIYRERVSVPI